jgi:hypothetical protein
MAKATEKAKTIHVQAEAPVLGMKRGAIAELVMSPYLQRVIDQGWLTQVAKRAGTDPAPLSDAAQVSAGERDAEAAAAASAVESAGSGG